MFLITTGIILIFSIGYAQPAWRRNSIYFEFPGNGIFGSVNYEYQFISKPGIVFRVGLGYWSNDGKFGLSYPAGLNHLTSLDSGSSLIDVSAGITWATQNLVSTKQVHLPADPENYFTNFVPMIGYRRHTDSHFMWRVNGDIVKRFATGPWLGLVS